MSNNNSNSGGKFALGALLGAAAGAVAAYLTAPKSGKETREDIKQRAGELKETAAKKTGEVLDTTSRKVNEFTKSAGDKADDLRDKAGNVVDDVAAAAKDAEERAMKTAGQWRDHAASAVDEAKKNFDKKPLGHKSNDK